MKGQRVKGQRGIALVEVLVAVALIGTVLSLVGNSLFQSWHHTQKTNDTILTEGNIRSAARWVFQDAQMSESTNLVDGAAPVSTLSLGWTDRTQGGTAHASTFQLQGSNLIRTFDGQSLTVAQHVASAQFWQTGRTIYVSFQAQGRGGMSVSRSYQIRQRTTG